MKALRHFLTITKHKILVAKGCFRVGLYRQGILHDMSKYSPVEFTVGAKYYQGTRSPNNAEKEATGVSMAWLHHKGRNKHHLEYWIDYAIGGKTLCGMRMPKKYVAEMFMDRIAACKVYLKDAYTQRSPLEYYEKGKDALILHDESRMLLENCLHKLADEGEDAAFSYIKNEVLKKPKRSEKNRGQRRVGGI